MRNPTALPLISSGFRFNLQWNGHWYCFKELTSRFAVWQSWDSCAGTVSNAMRRNWIVRENLFQISRHPKSHQENWLKNERVDAHTMMEEFNKLEKHRVILNPSKNGNPRNVSDADRNEWITIQISRLKSKQEKWLWELGTLKTWSPTVPRSIHLRI